jgi:hypothetical protein
VAACSTTPDGLATGGLADGWSSDLPHAPRETATTRPASLTMAAASWRSEIVAPPEVTLLMLNLRITLGW